MFSSLNSVLRNCLKQLRPAALFITFSNDVDQERASSRVGLRLKDLKDKGYIGSVLFNPASMVQHLRDGLRRRSVIVFCGYLSSQLPVPSVLRSQVDLCIVSSSLRTVKLEADKKKIMRLPVL